MSEPEMQVCPTCQGAGELNVQEQSVHYTYSDGSKIPNPQIVTIIVPRLCGTCNGNRWLQGGSR